MNEADFFANIATRLGRTDPLMTQPARDAVGAPGFWRNYSLSPENRLARFQEELTQLGGSAFLCETPEALQNGLSRQLAALTPARVGLWGDGVLERYGLESVVACYDHVVWSASAGSLEESVPHVFAQVDVGITGCDYAVADTGTLVLIANESQGRSVSLLPSVHMALVPASKIYTRMGEVWDDVIRRFGPDGLPSSINFITGPSRSSDIENDLSIGVHGPAAVYAFLLLYE